MELQMTFTRQQSEALDRWLTTEPEYTICDEVYCYEPAVATVTESQVTYHLCEQHLGMEGLIKEWGPHED